MPYDGPVVVLGDSMVDKITFGSVTRVSPERPIPILNKDKTEWYPGGAANTALNLLHLGHKVFLITALGEDEEGEYLQSWVEKTGAIILHNYVSEYTTVKHRYIAGRQHIMRVDRDCIVPEGARDYFLPQLNELREYPILVSDYKKGVVTPQILDNRMGVVPERPIVIDPGLGRDALYYTNKCKDIWFKMNSREFQELGYRYGCQFVGKLSSKLNPVLIVTEGDRGATFWTRSISSQIPIVKKYAVDDTTGAGDAAAAGLMSAILRRYPKTLTNKDIPEIVQEMLAVASYRVSVDAVPSNMIYAVQDSISSSLLGHACVGLSDDIAQSLSAFRRWGGKIAVVSGCLDGFHIGHLGCVRYARDLAGNHGLVIATINDDDGVRELKGPGRPYMDRTSRGLILLNAGVDLVLIFPGTCNFDILRAVKPDYLVKGGDYVLDRVKELELVKEWGGKVELAPMWKGVHSTDLFKGGLDET